MVCNTALAKGAALSCDHGEPVIKENVCLLF